MAKTTSAERNRAMREKRKNAGRCIQCGGPLEAPGTASVDRDRPATGTPRSIRCGGCVEKNRKYKTPV